VAFACALATFAVYAATLAPTVTGGDSGELVAVAATFGIAHPPGYPLYTLLAAAFARLVPFGEVAWRVHLLSAVCGAAAAGLAAWSAARLSGQPAGGIVAAALFAFSPLVWPYAVTAEVFALNNAFAAGLVALTVAASLDAPGRRGRWLLAGGAVTGIGLGNHHTLVFVAAPALAWLIAMTPGRARVRLTVLAAASGLAALALVYAYLPLAAARGPVLAWGDPTTVDGFRDHVLRREYGTFRLASAETGAAGADTGARIAQIVERFTATSHGLGPLLALTALFWLLDRGPQRRLVVLWSAGVAAYVAVFASLANVRMDLPLHVTVQERFWQQALVVVAVLAGLGYAWVARVVGRPALALAVAVALGAAQAAVHFREMDHRGRTFFADWGRAVLESAPEGALLLATSDETIGALRYVQLVRGVRPDVRVVPTGQVTTPWMRAHAARMLPGIVFPPPGADGTFTARAFLDANVPRRAVLLLNRVPWLSTLEEAYTPWAWGVVERVLPKGERPGLERYVAEAEASFARFEPPRRPERGTWEEAVAESYWKQYARYAAAVPRVAEESTDPGSARLVVAALERHAARHPDPERITYKNLGVAYQFLAREDPAARAGMVRHWRTYLERAPASDPDLPGIRTLIARAEADGVRP
jgi:hypothetical protein